MKYFTDYLKKLFVLAVIVFVAGYVFFYLTPMEKPDALYYIYIFFFLTSALIHYFLLKASEKKQERFPAYFMGSISFKLFVSLIFIVSYVLHYPGEAKKFLLSFFIIYLIYTSFETILILRHFRPK